MRKKFVISRYKWAPLCEDYDRFQVTHRGLAPATRRATRGHIQEYLNWQFGRRDPDWSKIRPHDFWRYASDLSRRWKRSTTNHALCALRSFFRYLHLRGDCPHSFELAVPRVANYAATSNAGVLSAAQRRQLLARCRKQTSAEGLRDYAMILCMLDLGLRARQDRTPPANRSRRDRRRNTHERLGDPLPAAHRGPRRYPAKGASQAAGRKIDAIVKPCLRCEALSPLQVRRQVVEEGRNRLSRHGTGHRPPGSTAAKPKNNGSSAYLINKCIDALPRRLDIAVERGQLAGNPL
jgi:hypothetical protein